MGFFGNLRDAFRGASYIGSALSGGAPDFMGVTGADGKITYYREQNHRDAYYSNAYRACALAKARPLASLPIHVYERMDGSRIESERTVAVSLSRLLRTKWNPFVTAQEGYRWLDMTKDALGNAFARVEWTDGVPTAIWPMAGVPEVEITDNGDPLFRYCGDKFTDAGVYLQREVIWVKSPVLDDDCLMGVSLAELAARELGLSIDLEDFYDRLIRNGNHFPRWLETDQALDENSFNRLKQQVSDGEGIVSAGKMRIFDRGLTVRTTNQSIADMSLIEQERWILQQVCRTLSVPPQEVFDLSNSTYSNIEQGAQNFANKTLVPECAEIERALSCVLWSAGLHDCYVQFDMNGLLRGNYRDRMDGYRIGIFSSILSPNDARAKEDMPPYEGGDKFFRSTAYAYVDPETGDMEYPEHLSGGSEQGGSGEGSPVYRNDAEGALGSIHDDMERRIRERIAEGGDTRKTRDFAAKVLSPYATACTCARIEYDMQTDIERMFCDEGH